MINLKGDWFFLERQQLKTDCKITCQKPLMICKKQALRYGCLLVTNLKPLKTLVTLADFSKMI